MRKTGTYQYTGLCALLATLVACVSHNETQSLPADTTTSVQQANIEKPAPVLHTSITVSIEQMKFQPDNITVSKGDTVIFVNHDMVAHDITEEKQEWKSQPVAASASWRFVPTKTANYYCSIHPVMKGKIIVQ